MLAVTIVCGGLWTRQRKQEAGLCNTDPEAEDEGKEDEIMCPFCGAEPDTLFHRTWGTCSAITACKLPSVEATKNLEERAKQEHDENSGYWLRGLLPQNALKLKEADAENVYHF